MVLVWGLGFRVGVMLNNRVPWQSSCNYTTHAWIVSATRQGNRFSTRGVFFPVALSFRLHAYKPEAQGAFNTTVNPKPYKHYLDPEEPTFFRTYVRKS